MDDLAGRWKFCVFVFWKTLPRYLCREVDPKMKKKEEFISTVVHSDSLFCLDGGLAVCARVFRVCQSASLLKNLRVKFAGILAGTWLFWEPPAGPGQHVGTDWGQTGHVIDGCVGTV